jgi:hypothetical protein
MSFCTKASTLFLSIGLYAFDAVCLPPETNKPLIAVFPCEIDSATTVTEASFITDRITLEIIKRDAYTVRDRYAIAKAVGRGSGEIACPDVACYFERAGACDAGLAIWGTLMRNGSALRLELELGDVAARQIKNSISFSYNGSSLELAEKIPTVLAGLLNLPPPVAPVPTPAQIPPPAKLTLRSDPAGAKVLINGNNAGTTPCTIDGIANDTCSIVLDLPGFYTFTERLSLKTGGSKKIFVHLRKLFGSLAVHSSPPHAEVIVAGVLKGTTPYGCDTMRPGSYSLRLSLDHYASITKSISIVSGKSDTVSATLISLAYLDSLSHAKAEKNRLVRKIVFGTGAAAFLGTGFYFNMQAHRALDDEKQAYAAYMRLTGSTTVDEFTASFTNYKNDKNKSDDLLSKRTICYVIGSVFLAGFGISIKF